MKLSRKIFSKPGMKPSLKWTTWLEFDMSYKLANTQSTQIIIVLAFFINDPVFKNYLSWKNSFWNIW